MLIGCFTYSENGNIIDGYDKCSNLEECYNIRIGSSRDGRLGGSILDINKRNGCAGFLFSIDSLDYNKATWTIEKIFTAMNREGIEVSIEGQRQLDSINNNSPAPQSTSKITSIAEWQMLRVND